MKRILPITLAFAFFMEMMDSTVISTALPAIASDINVSPITLKLALTSYLVALGIFIPISGWIADHFGAKRVFQMAILVFILGSIACALSSSLPAFVISRFIQGMGGSMMTPIGRLIIVRSVSKKDFVSAMNWVTIPGLIGPMAGPPLGGFITTYFSWHWIFIINVPIGLIGIWLAGRYLPSLEARQTPRVDFTGFLLTGLSAAGIVFGLSVVSLPALPPIVGIICLAVGVASFFLYLRHTKRVANPILDPSLFKNAAFRLSILGGTMFRVASGAQPFLVPLMLQLNFGLNPFLSGLVTFVGAFGALCTKPFSKRVLSMFGFRAVMTASAICGALTIAVFAVFKPGMPYWIAIVALFASGLARSMLFTSANSLTLTSVDDEKASHATSISSVFQQVGMALGVAFGGLLLESGGLFHDKALSLASFHLAFGVTAAVCALSSLIFIALPSDAGAEIAGRKQPVKA